MLICGKEDHRASLEDQIQVMEKDAHHKSMPYVVDSDSHSFNNKIDQLELEGNHKQLLEISNKFSKMKKERMSKTVYNPVRRSKQRNKMTDI